MLRTSSSWLCQNTESIASHLVLCPTCSRCGLHFVTHVDGLGTSPSIQHWKPLLSTWHWKLYTISVCSVQPFSITESCTMFHCPVEKYTQLQHGTVWSSSSWRWPTSTCTTTLVLARPCSLPSACIQVPEVINMLEWAICCCGYRLPTEVSC